MITKITPILKKVKLSEDAELIAKTQLFHIFQKKVTLFNKEKTYFEYLVRKPTVSIITITNDKKLVVLNQKQPGNSSFIDFPSGSLDSYEENEIDAAKRELLEETGMISNNIIKLKTIKTNDVILWYHTIFIAKDCVKISNQNLDEGEKICIKYREIDDIFEIINNEKFRDIYLKGEINSYLISKLKKKEFLDLLKDNKK